MEDQSAVMLNDQGAGALSAYLLVLLRFYTEEKKLTESVPVH
jgi:hypothetical protein